MRSLIEDLLRLSQVNAVQLERRDFDLSQMVQSIFDELQRHDPERRIETVIEPAVMCNADPALLRIALQNLLGNAWKFTGKAAAPRIAFGAVPGQGYFIEDNGAGFDAEAAAEMFAPFRRLHHESEFPGTGIGLSIVQRIIRKHGGAIRAEGVVGKGARFDFSL
jgi:signal transduction histidine kinase